VYQFYFLSFVFIFIDLHNKKTTQQTYTLSPSIFFYMPDVRIMLRDWGVQGEKKRERERQSQLRILPKYNNEKTKHGAGGM
jgi:hypothetical protein